MFGASPEVQQRLKHLEDHLQQENPLLVDTVKSFEHLDRVGYRLGLLGREQSYAMQVPWWPLISVLGTFSAGKSTFINHYLEFNLQDTGTQAVDDKFTVICYGRDEQVRVLPGIALDADPRFPFYQMREELEHVAPGEGTRVDAYLRLKTVPSERVRSVIFIDSPGFDADAQRTATLRITDYIIDLSDLVLVFFDARHPEPGAMRDTLAHLVANTMRLRDSSKILYILNQIDTTAREDNPEDVVAAWQRALAQEGLTAGKFFCIYNADVAIPIDDPALRERFESKRDADLAEIHDRIRQVGVERAYRIVGALEKTAHQIEDTVVPKLRELNRRWRYGVLWRDAAVLALVLAGLIAGSVMAGHWQGLRFTAPEWLASISAGMLPRVVAIVVVVLIALWVHFVMRRWAAKSIVRSLRRKMAAAPEREQLIRAFGINTRAWRSIFSPGPAGWGRRTRKQLQAVIVEADRFVQALNDQFANPSGLVADAAPAGGAAEALEEVSGGAEMQPEAGSPREDDAPVSSPAPESEKHGP